MEITDKTKVIDEFYGYLKENWNGYINKNDDTLRTNKFHLSWIKIAKVWFYLKDESDEVFTSKNCNRIDIEVRKKYVDYNDLKNVLKSFENLHHDIKINLEIIYEFKY